MLQGTVVVSWKGQDGQGVDKETLEQLLPLKYLGLWQSATTDH